MLVYFHCHRISRRNALNCRINKPQWIHNMYNIQPKHICICFKHTAMHGVHGPYQIIYGRSLFRIQCTLYIVRIQTVEYVHFVSADVFHFLQVNFHLEYDVFNWKANYFIVSIFGSLTFSFIYYTTLFCSIVHSAFHWHSFFE